MHMLVFCQSCSSQAIMLHNFPGPVIMPSKLAKVSYFLLQYMCLGEHACKWVCTVTFWFVHSALMCNTLNFLFVKRKIPWPGKWEIELEVGQTVIEFLFCIDANWQCGRWLRNLLENIKVKEILHIFTSLDLGLIYGAVWGLIVTFITLGCLLFKKAVGHCPNYCCCVCCTNVFFLNK